MEFIKPGINIDFIGKRKIAYFFSGSIILLTFFLLIWQGGPKYGVDFTGGVLIQVRFDNRKSIDDIRAALRPINLDDSIIQEFKESGISEYLIRMNSCDL